MSNYWKQMWDTRPRRFPRRQNGSNWVAGVCEGIAVRYQIDPMLVRLAFVFTGLTGSGIVLYLLLCVLLPRYSVDRAPIETLFISRGSRYARDRRLGWILIILLLVFNAALLSLITPQNIATFGIAVLAWWALHKRLPNPPAGLMAPQSEQEQFSDPVNLAGYMPAAGFAAPFSHPSVPEWDPLTTQLYGDNTMTYYDPALWTASTTPAVSVKKRRIWPRVLVGLALMVALPLLLVQSFIKFSDGNTNNITVTSEQQLSDGQIGQLGGTVVDFRQLPEAKSDHTYKIRENLGDIKVFLNDKVRYRIVADDNLGTLNIPEGIVNPDVKGGLITILITDNCGSVTVQP